MIGIMKLDTYLYLITSTVLCVSANVVVISNDTLQKIEVFYSLLSDFGGDNTKEGMQGYLVAADPIEACNEIKQPPEIDSSIHWIALVRRGNCTFSEKVYNAQNSKFDAVIVFNKLSDDVVTMHCEENCDLITIPSVFVGSGDGLRLLKTYLYYMAPGYIIWISNDLPFSFNSYFIPFVVIVIVCFLMMAGFMLVKCIRSRRQARRHRMPSSSLKKIPVIKYKKADPYDVCAICLEEYEEGDALRILPCSHGYHTKCVDPWLTKNKRVCPCCKRKVFAENENQYESDSDSDFSNSENTPLLRDGNLTRRQGGGTFDNSQETNVLIANERQPLVSSSSSEDSNEDELSVPDEVASHGSHTPIEIRT